MRACMARISVRTPNGDESVGTAFHIGDGYYVTARHVVDGNAVTEFKPEGTPGNAYYEQFPESAGKKPTIRRVIYPSDAKVDLAILETTNLPRDPLVFETHRVHAPDNPQAEVEIGGHIDEYLGDEFTLQAVMALGYVPVPQNRDVRLLVVETHVSSVVDPYSMPYTHFVLAAVPRGGFSGGPVLMPGGYLVGVMTGSLYEGEQPYELGFAVALSIEPLLVALSENGIYPGRNGATVRVLIEGSDEWEASLARQIRDMYRCPSCLLRFKRIVGLGSRETLEKQGPGVFERAKRHADVSRGEHAYWSERVDCSSDQRTLRCSARRSWWSLALRLGRSAERVWRIST